MAILVLTVAILFFTVFSTLICFVAAKTIGLGVPLIELGVWGPKLNFSLGASKFRITPWLFASSYTIKESPNLDLYGDHPGKPFNAVNPLLRAAIIVCGPFGLLLLCTSILGATTFSVFKNGFWQIFAGALSPFGLAQILISSFWQAASVAPLEYGAVVLAKFAAFALLPLPSQSGGNAILQIVRWNRKDYPNYFGILFQLGMLGVLLLALSWAIAFAWFLLKSGAI